MHSIDHRTDQQFQPRFLTFPFSNTLHMEMPVRKESHLGNFGAPILGTFGLCGMFFYVDKLLKSSIIFEC